MALVLFIAPQMSLERFKCPSYTAYLLFFFFQLSNHYLDVFFLCRDRCYTSSAYESARLLFFTFLQRPYCPIVLFFYIFYIGFLSETGWLILSANLVWPKAGQPLGVAASCDCSTTTALFALSTSLPATWKYRLGSVSWTLLAGIIKQMSFFEPKTQGVAVLKVLTTLFFLM